MPGVIKESVRGLLTLSGGTRTSVKTARPWQPKLVFQQKEQCPFCSKSQDDEFAIAEGWKTFQNSNTPFPYHRLLIPTECWDEQKLRSLGGANTIEMILQLAFREILRTQKNSYPMWVYTHVGYGAGQNIAHNHWHLCEAPTPPKRFEIGEGCAPLWDGKNFRTRLCGVRAGQAEIDFCPLSDNLFLEDPIRQLPRLGLLGEFAAQAFRLVDSFNTKFVNPDYCLFFGFNGGNEWHARYTPILNNQGGPEFAALDYGTPFVLPWPHEATRDFLLAE